MWSAGIAWDRAGYTVACVRSDGTAGPGARFGADEVARIAAHVRTVCGPGATVVVDSTNGLLDGPLRVFGLTVLRADPWDLPARPSDASVTAAELAACALARPGRLVATDDDAGTLSGRVAELAAHAERSAETAADLAGQGRYLLRGDGGGAGHGRRIALTFDDGPTAPYTDRVLDILRDHGVPGTFFCVGLHAAASPGTVARIAAEGHGIGNHTWSHPFLPDLSRDDLLFQLDATNAALEAVTGVRPGHLRTPYGSRTPDTLRWTAEHGMTTVLWDTDTQDWAAPGAEQIVANARQQARDGSIVLMHDGGGDRSQTVAALPVLIGGLLDDGYRLVTVDELVGA
ncbi:polysaccharide deacetylase family protein [Streptacidiphilus albus]|uniref:polysaccharide deacetylase family protein n=1 Tax=Streptacidiphilus albus TaxID=105425 RepID=UPI00054B77AF|nr:polysaccharide deacetylase family protein [Streptacidiphilus albus]